MEFLLNEALNFPAAEEIRRGWVVEHRNNEILVDIGAKSEGIIPNKEVETFDAETKKRLAIGSEIMVYVVDPEDNKGNIILSYAKAAEAQDWLKAEELFQSQEVYQGKVIGYNRGGVLVRMGQIRGFIPNSQLRRDRYIGQELDERQIQKMVGYPVHVKVVEVHRQRNRLILSERAAEQEMREAKRTNLFNTLQEGSICEGRVVNIADFGAFVDIGGVEGLVHLSELSWKRINNPAEKLQLGDKVKVYVLSIDQEKQRLALSIKRLESDPWNTIHDQYRVGQLVTAYVTKLTKFGAFARLNDQYELEGLIHISELSENHVTHPRDVVKPEQEVTVRIIRIDPEQRQLGLSLKQVASDKFIEADLQMLTTV